MKINILLICCIFVLNMCKPEKMNVLLFTKTNAFVHDAKQVATDALTQLGRENSWNVIHTEDSLFFNDDSLKNIDVIVFLLTSGDVFDDSQKEAFKRFIHSGKGFVGIHSATDTEYKWAWFDSLLGAHFLGHPPVQSGKIIIEKHQHPAVPKELNKYWNREDEWYSFDKNPREHVKVLMSVDENSYRVDENPWFEGKDLHMGDHPLVWYQIFEGGKVFQTALGHTKESYSDPLFLEHIEGAINWAGGRE